MPARIALALALSALSGAPRLLPPPLADLIRVNIVGRRADGMPDDRRGTLPTEQAQLGLSDAEAARIRATTGLILCDLDGMKALATGTLAGDDTTLVTAAHVLRDPARDGVELPRGTRCVFRSQSLPPETVPLRLDGSEVLGPGGRGDVWDPNDYAVVHLAAPLHNPAAVPFPVGRAPTTPGSPVILVSAFQVDLQPDFGNRDPIVQQAGVELAGPTGPGAPQPIYLAGAMEAGGSGGPVLVRQGGKLRLVAIVSTTGNFSRDGMPFSLSMGSFVRVIGIEAGFRAAIDAATDAQCRAAPDLQTQQPC